MSKRTTIQFLTAAAVAALIAAAWAFAAVSPAASAPASASKVRVVTIKMKDPGCHWFRVAGKDLARLTVHGKTSFRNLDEAALTFKGDGFFKRVPVGKTLTISQPGVYRIKMVHQHPDDNVLKLTLN
jgi:hypothetical protein